MNDSINPADDAPLDDNASSDLPMGNPTPREQAEDALVDAALRETLGGEEPTDQTDVILERAEEEKLLLASNTGSKTRSWGMLLAVAASIAVVGGTLVMQSNFALMQSAYLTNDSLADEESQAVETKKKGLQEEVDDSFFIESVPIAAQETEPLLIELEASAPGGAAVGSKQANGRVVAGSQFTADLDTPFRQGDFNVAVPAFGGMGEGELVPASPPVSVDPAPKQFGRIAGNWQHKAEISSPHSISNGPSRSAAPAVEQFGMPNPGRFNWKESMLQNSVQPESRSRSQYAKAFENAFTLPKGEDALSTFSIDVDTASYANTRQILMQSNHMPPAGAVRIEELVNYFDYGYDAPEADSETPFHANMEVAACPWEPKHRLVRIAIKGREVENEQRPLTNLVFLIDVSGSMNQPNKLPLVVRGLKQLTRRLGENDRVAIVVYASSQGLALDSTPGSERQTILSSLDSLAAGGSTAGGAGIQLAYKIAEENFIKGGTNRVLLCTDGDFNVGISNTEALGQLVETKVKESGVYLSVLGFGRGNLNDKMLEAITNRGNGNYSFIDSAAEARKVLVDQMTGTLVTIAKDVKLQIEFNPAKVARYRLVGYENRVLANQDFNDDTKDAGEIGAGHTVTAFYEVVPVGVTPTAGVDQLKYQPAKEADSEEPEADTIAESTEPVSDDLLTLKIRYKQPDANVSSKLEFTLVDEGKSFEEATLDYQFASSVAQFGLLLRNSEHRGKASYDAVTRTADLSLGDDKHGYREEFLDLVDQARKLSGGTPLASPPGVLRD